MTQSEALARHTERAVATFLSCADDLARETAAPPAIAIALLRREMQTRLAGTAADIDCRRSRWRVRGYLFRIGWAEAQYDTDPGLPAGAPGQAIKLGLPGVAEWLSIGATGFHQSAGGQSVTGLDLATLEHRLKSLRPTLSRRGGNATWRVPYQVDGAEWQARIDVVREG